MEAKAIADNLVDANLTGHDSHGVARVPRYLQHVENGWMHFGRQAESLTDGGSFVLLEGHFGFGQTIGTQAIELGVTRARQHGVSTIALRNAGHLGRIGAWAEQACANGLVSVHFVNVARSMLVAPAGAAERRISTAPVCVGVPNAHGDDFLLDFATSRVAEGKALVALHGGPPLPPASLIDGDGRPTHDPRALYGETSSAAEPDPRAGPGALTAMGDHKGSGLALACELLAGALTGSGTTGPGKGPYNGMLSFFVEPGRLDDGSDIPQAVSTYIDFVRQARPADEEHPVMIPGDPERMAQTKRSVHGIPLARGTWQSLVAAATKLGLGRERIPQSK